MLLSSTYVIVAAIDEEYQANYFDQIWSFQISN